ncbi:MAG TPA: Xaa-Pro peptidase family protein [Gemmatimonadaceae bacterium]|nr:Xaa-Pro peptidase family protein [Gemmatimonadaceae bacterium]
MLTPRELPAIQAALAGSSPALDGWLLYDFHGLNPVATGLLELHGMTSRRWFVLVPRSGAPVAITHAIEQGPWSDWPAGWTREVYSSWRSLEALLAKHLAGRTVAMEYSPDGAVPYLDRIPAGALEMIRAAGATVVSSSDLVSRFFAAWTPPQLASHQRAAVAIAAIANEAMQAAGAASRSTSPLTEYALQQRIVQAFTRAGLECDHPPIVAVGANAANPHFEPLAEGSAVIRDGDLLLVDLWAREQGGAGIWADQTWMASLGTPSARAVEVWTAVRDARDAAIALLHERAAAGAPVRGAEVDDAARAVITARGFGDRFVHRTGHSIDPRDLHGSGPHLDNLETRDDRVLLPGVAFSIEPGVYITGEIGVRSEVNAIMGDGEVIVTPADYQRELPVL